MHKHHIIPKHAGGTDDPENLIELTVEEHAAAHKKLYEIYGKREDLLAWKALAKQIGKEEIWLVKSSLGGIRNADVPKSNKHKQKISNTIKKMHAEGHYYDNPAKISKSMMGNTNSKNHSSPEYKKKHSDTMKSWHEKRRRG